MSAYWKRREQLQRQRFQTKKEKEIEARLRKNYKRVADSVTTDIELLYLRLLDEGEDTLANNLYRYNRYYQLRERINLRLKELGADTLEELCKGMKDMYVWTSTNALNDIGFETPSSLGLRGVAESLWDNRESWSERVWCADGLNASQRIAKNMAKLQETLERGLQDCVARGVGKDELVKTLMKRFDVSYSDANRVARTELTYVQNQATKDSFVKAGVKEYEYLAEIDDRTSEECEELDGQRFPIESAIVGVNYPPRHPNCRCTVLAVLD